MSAEVNFVNSVDNRQKALFAQFKKPTYKLPVGYQNMTFNTANVQNASTSGTTYTFTVQPNQILAPVMIEELTFSLTLTSGNVLNANASFVNTSAPRFFPIDSASQSCTVSINGTTIGNLNASECITPLLSFGKCPELDQALLSAYASMIDSFAGSGGAYASSTAAIQTGMVGSNLNPLGTYWTNTYGNYSRLSSVDVTAWDGTQRNVNNPLNNTFTFTVRTPIITGLTGLVDNIPGFVGITQNVVVQRNFLNNLAQRILSLAIPSANIPNLVATVAVSDANLYYSVFTPAQNMVIPKRTYYNYLDYAIFNNSQYKNLTVAGNTAQVVSQALTINNIPKAIYVWGSLKQASQKTMFDSDCPSVYFTNLALNAYNVSGQFSNMTQFQLYNEFCARQGFNKSYNESTSVAIVQNGAAIFQPGFGQVLRISGEMLSGIDWSKYSVGSSLPTNLQITATFEACDSAYTGNIYLNILVVNECLVEINSDDGSCRILNGLLSPEEIAKVRAHPEYTEISHPMLGGNIFGDIWHGIKKGAQALGKYAWDHKGDIARAGLKMAGLGRKSHKKKHSKKGSAMLAGRRHRRRSHRMRGGALTEDESDYSDYECDCSGSECNSECECDDCLDYSGEGENSGSESCSESSSEEEMKGGKVLPKSALKNRLRFIN